MIKERSFSWSRIDTFITCPYRYYLRYVKNISSKRKAKALAAGSTIAKFLEVFRTGKSYKDCINDVCLYVDQKEKDNLFWKKIDDPQRSVERLLEIMFAYTVHYPNEPNQIIQPEITFEYPFFLTFNNEEMKIIFNGRLDGVIESDHSFALIEDKTTSRLGDTFFKEKIDSFQVLWYLWVAQKMGLFDVSGKKQSPKCLINAIYIHATNCRFEREITIKSNQSLECSFQQMQIWLKCILLAEKQNQFPKNFNSCQNYKGCEYLHLRDTDENSQMWNRMINSFYKIDEKR